MTTNQIIERGLRAGIAAKCLVTVRQVPAAIAPHDGKCADSAFEAVHGGPFTRNAQPSTPARTTLKRAAYALEHPEAPGLYFRLDGERPRLRPLAQACLMPATDAGRTEIIRRASDRLNPLCIPYNLVRLEPRAEGRLA